MIETRIIIHWNANRPMMEMQDTIKMVRAILDNEAKKNTLGYKITKMKVV